MNKVFQTAYPQNKETGYVRKYFTAEATKTLVCSLVQASKHEHISPPLVDLHWLPVCHRIQYKIATVYYNIISGSAPPCLADRLRLYTPSQTLGSSADLRIFCIPIKCKRFHKQRIFCYTGPVIWNSLPFPVHHFQRLLSFSSTIGSAVLRSQFISVHACMHVYMHVSVCVCVCTNVMWEGFGVI